MNACPPLKVLMVEDSPADAEMVLRALRDLGREFEHVRVASESRLRDALSDFAPDVVLSDFSMPGFSGQEALEVVRVMAPHVPFVYVSGTIGEELAILALQRGAIDYVLKDNLRRLPSAVERALGIARDRCERQHIEQALRESEERFRSIVENSKDWIWENERDTRTTYSNSAIARILGYRPEELIDTLAVEHMLEEDRDEVRRRIPELVAARQGWSRWRLRWRHRNGGIRVLESTAVPRMDANGEVIGYRGVDQDVTDRLHHEARIRHLARIHAVLSALGNTILRAQNRAELMDHVCKVAVDQGGFKAACVGEPRDGQPLALVAGYGDPRVVELISTLGEGAADCGDDGAMRPGVRAFCEGRNVIVRDFSCAQGMPEGFRRAAMEAGVAAQVALPIGNPAWGVLGLYSGSVQEFDEDELALLQRMTDEIDYAVDFLAKSERLAYLAYHNPVTGLPNRSAFREQVASLLEEGRVAVAVLDVTRFAYINESRGRGFGDALLREIGARLRWLVEPDGVLAHAEADSFLVAYPANGGIQAEQDRVDALLERFQHVGFIIEDEQIHAELHGGLALGPDHGRDAEVLERNAMLALAEGGKRGVRLHAFTEELQGRVARRMELERDLRRALDAQEFELYYQPKLDCKTHRVVAAEALLRWRHPRAGLVSPAEFIPVLEETGMIVAVGHWVMRTALETVKRWRGAGHDDFRVCVNVSPRELRNPRFLDDCRELLQGHAAAQMIDIELTESLLMDDIQHSVQSLEALRQLGCEIAIDDFGTGYSSLNYLARLPVDMLKIDQSFVALITESPQSLGLVTNIINLAHSLSLAVVAEGVETEEQAKLLRLLRCDVLQGYLIGRPMPEEPFARQFLGIDATA